VLKWKFEVPIVIASSGDDDKYKTIFLEQLFVVSYIIPMYTYPDAGVFAPLLSLNFF